FTTEYFKNEEQRAYAQRTREALANSRKAIEENPGKEAPDLRKVFQAASTSADMAAKAAPVGTALASEREAKLEKLVGTPAADFKAGQTVGGFKSVAGVEEEGGLGGFF